MTETVNNQRWWDRLPECINRRGRNILTTVSHDQITPGMMFDFYHENPKEFRGFPHHSLVMMDAQYLTKNHISILKKHDMIGLANIHPTLLNPSEFAVAIKHSYVDLMSIYHGLEKDEKYFRICEEIISHHAKTYEPHTRTVVAALAKNPEQKGCIHHDYLKYMGVKTAMHICVSSDERNAVRKFFGTHAALTAADISTEERTRWLKDDMNL